MSPIDEHENATEDVQLPDDRVEDLEPDEGEAADVEGGKHIGQPKYEDIKLSP
jgi:hypothetical protein